MMKTTKATILFILWCVDTIGTFTHPPPRLIGFQSTEKAIEEIMTDGPPNPCFLPDELQEEIVSSLSIQDLRSYLSLNRETLTLGNRRTLWTRWSERKLSPVKIDALIYLARTTPRYFALLYKALPLSLVKELRSKELRTLSFHLSMSGNDDGREIIGQFHGVHYDTAAISSLKKVIKSQDRLSGLIEWIGNHEDESCAISYAIRTLAVEEIDHLVTQLSNLFSERFEDRMSEGILLHYCMIELARSKQLEIVVKHYRCLMIRIGENDPLGLLGSLASVLSYDDRLYLSNSLGVDFLLASVDTTDPVLFDYLLRSHRYKTSIGDQFKLFLTIYRFRSPTETLEIMNSSPTCVAIAQTIKDATIQQARQNYYYEWADEFERLFVTSERKKDEEEDI